MSAFVELLGETLAAEGEKTVRTKDALKDKEVVALYFSAHWCPPCRGFTPKLAEWYTKDLKEKNMEVVFVSSDQDESAFDEYRAEQPWLSLPFEDRARKTALAKKYKCQGIPYLVLLDGQGNTITTNGRAKVSNDPAGEDFPWKPLPFSEIIGEEFLKHGDPEQGEEEVAKTTREELSGKTIAIYFSAHWCPPCQTFTPLLVEFYKKMQAESKDFEIIFASSDRDEESFTSYWGEMPWLALPLATAENGDKRKERLSEHFQVSGIPKLVFLEDIETGTLITDNGRARIGNDPEGTEFPFYPKLVREIGEDADDIDERPSFCVFQEACADEDKEKMREHLGVVAQEIKDKAAEAKDDPQFNVFLASKASPMGGRIKEILNQKEADCETPFAVLLDLEDHGGYYLWDENRGAVTAESVKTFLEEYKGKKLERKQLG